MLKKLLVTGMAVCTLLTADAQTIKTPQPSPTQIIKQDFGVGTIELSYSRPGVKGRKIYSDIAPAGQVWRTGANNATTLTFSDEVMIGGTKIAPGKYGLVSIPNQDNWTMIITKQLDVTSPAAYKQENDVVRVTVKPMRLPMPAETLTMQFANLKQNSTDLHIMWGDVALALPITMDIDSSTLR